MNLKEAIEVAMKIIPYRYNVPAKEVTDATNTVWNAAKDGTLKELVDRDEGLEPVLESRTSTYHELYADGTGSFKTKEFVDWFCPKCGYFVGELYSGFGMWHIQDDRCFCMRCGQRIDWTKPKEEEKRRYEERRAREREEAFKRNNISLDNMNAGRRRKYGLMEGEK